MLSQYTTVYEGGEGEIIVKKSRFIRDCTAGRKQKRKPLLLLQK